MLVIRLSRVGKRKHPTYRIVVQEKTRSPSSTVLEFIGHYDPHTDPATIVVQEDRVKHWMGNGAQLSPTLNNLFIDRGLIKGTKQRIVQPKLKQKEEGAAPAAPVAPKTEAAPEPKAEAPKEEKPAQGGSAVGGKEAAPEPKAEKPAEEKKEEEAPKA